MFVHYTLSIRIYVVSLPSNAVGLLGGFEYIYKLTQCQVHYELLAAQNKDPLDKNVSK